METYLSFIVAALALTGSPGPNTLSLAAVGAAFGFRRGLGFMLGLNFGMLLVIIIVGSGVAGLLFLVPGAGQAVIMLAAIYFIYLAYKIATAPPLSNDQDNRDPPKWYAAVFVSLANPKAYAAMAAMFSGFVLFVESSIVDIVLKSMILLLVLAFVNVLWLLVGAALTPLLRNPATSRVINVMFAVALIISVTVAALL